MRTLISAAVLALTLTACGGSDEPAKESAPESTSSSEATSEPTEEPTSSVVPDASYGSVTDLRDALVELGYPCPNWKQDNALTFASSSGTCSDADVMSVYVDAADLKSQIDTLREFGAFEDDFGGPMLAGPNWLLNIEDIETYREGLGGTVVAN